MGGRDLIDNLEEVFDEGDTFQGVSRFDGERWVKNADRLCTEDVRRDAVPGRYFFSKKAPKRPRKVDLEMLVGTWLEEERVLSNVLLLASKLRIQVWMALMRSP